MQLTTTYPDHNYPIIIEHAAFNQLDALVSDYQHVFVFVDQNVYTAWEQKFLGSFTIIHIPRFKSLQENK